MIIKKINILGVNISVINLALAFDVIKEMSTKGDRGYICVAPVSTLVDCQRLEGYRQVINQAVVVTPDGMPVVWLAKFKGAKEIERTYGPDLMRLVCNQGQACGLRHFFYGGSEETLVQLQNHLRAVYPKIVIAGSYAPPFIAQAQRENDEIIKLINNSRADVLWVGLGSPKQDFWMAIHRPLLSIPVIIGSGAAFDFLAGVKPEAPRWMQYIALGWFFRLCSEPRRLWRRYLIGNMLFIYYLLKDLFRKSHDS